MKNGRTKNTFVRIDESMVVLLEEEARRRSVHLNTPLTVHRVVELILEDFLSGRSQEPSKQTPGEREILGRLERIEALIAGTTQDDPVSGCGADLQAGKAEGADADKNNGKDEGIDCGMAPKPFKSEVINAVGSSENFIEDVGVVRWIGGSADLALLPDEAEIASVSLADGRKLLITESILGVFDRFYPNVDAHQVVRMVVRATGKVAIRTPSWLAHYLVDRMDQEYDAMAAVDAISPNEKIAGVSEKNGKPRGVKPEGLRGKMIQSSAADGDYPAYFVFVKGRKESYPIYASYLRELEVSESLVQAGFTPEEIAGMIKAACFWCETNDGGRPTIRGLNKFFLNWIKKEMKPKTLARKAGSERERIREGFFENFFAKNAIQVVDVNEDSGVNVTEEQASFDMPSGMSYEGDAEAEAWLESLISGKPPSGAACSDGDDAEIAAVGGEDIVDADFEMVSK